MEDDLPTRDDGATEAQKLERKALRLSLAASAALGVVAAVWGLLAGSMVIILDAVWYPLSLLLTYGSMVVSRIAGERPTRLFPYGRSALIPLFVIAQAIVLFVLLGYASLEAVRVILDGGSEVAGVALLSYGLFSTVASIVIWWVLRRMDKGQALIKAEAAGWLSGVVSSACVAAGGLFVLVARGTAFERLSPFADSVLVLVASVLLMAVPVALLRASIRELQNPMPGPEVTRRVEDAIAAVTAEEGLPSPITRIGLMGRTLTVELAYVLAPGAGDVFCEDRLRVAMRERLATLPYDPWVVVEFSHRRDLVE
ncbi:MAG TPA: cation transporter [Arachnia sp.]|nr:cation transporter [Arachnia sp.]HMT86030.1 cation transporter [Arachnia sp.]